MSVAASAAIRDPKMRPHRRRAASENTVVVFHDVSPEARMLGVTRRYLARARRRVHVDRERDHHLVSGWCFSDSICCDLSSLVLDFVSLWFVSLLFVSKLDEVSSCGTPPVKEGRTSTRA